MHRSFELDKTFFMFLQLSSILFVLLFGFFYVTLFSHCTSLHLALYVDSMVSFPWPLIQYFVSLEFLCFTGKKKNNIDLTHFVKWKSRPIFLAQRRWKAEIFVLLFFGTSPFRGEFSHGCFSLPLKLPLLQISKSD